jgi:D-glycero-D-manno-heptose 1,7-bisphosphate phosphatase
MTCSTAQPTVFLDRDNTLIEDPGYISDPDQVRVLDGVPAALRRLQDAGYRLVIVTNQSGIARGLLTENDLAAIHDKLRSLLRAEGVDVDAIYYCPYLDGPEATCEAYRRDSELRKPKPGMILLAARELGIDLGRSWMVGDSGRDVQAGRAAGCRTILVGAQDSHETSSPDRVVDDLDAAADYITAQGIVAGCDAMSHEDQDAGQECPPATDGATPSSKASGEALDQILEELRTIRRERQYDDFSIGRLAGSIAQAFALCAIGWGLYTWMSASPGPEGVGVDAAAATSATIKLLLGIAVQLLALTCFVASRK